MSQKIRAVVIISAKIWFLFHAPGVKCAHCSVLGNWGLSSMMREKAVDIIALKPQQNKGIREPDQEQLVET